MLGLSKDLAYAIIDRVDSGEEPSRVAESIGVTRQTIHYILRGERHKEIWIQWVEDHGRKPNFFDWRMEGHTPKRKVSREDVYEILTLIDKGSSLSRHC